MLSGLVVLSYLSVLFVIMVILAPTPVHSVLFSMCFYVSFGWLIILLGYDIVGVVLILIYAGALVVMFLFVVMSFDLTRSSATLCIEGSDVYSTPWSRAITFLLLFGVVVRLSRPVWFVSLGFNETYFASIVSYGRFNFYMVLDVSGSGLCTVLNDISTVLYQGFYIPLLLCGLLILVGLVGAVLLVGRFRLLPVKRRQASSIGVERRVRRRIIVLR